MREAIREVIRGSSEVIRGSSEVIREGRRPDLWPTIKG
jgi:hypothetical protein